MASNSIIAIIYLVSKRRLTTLLWDGRCVAKAVMVCVITAGFAGFQCGEENLSPRPSRSAWKTPLPSCCHLQFAFAKAAFLSRCPSLIKECTRLRSFNFWNLYLPKSTDLQLNITSYFLYYASWQRVITLRHVSDNSYNTDVSKPQEKGDIKPYTLLGFSNDPHTHTHKDKTKKKTADKKSKASESRFTR